jgi:hypothetical protein
MGKLLQLRRPDGQRLLCGVDVFAVARPRVIPRNCPAGRGEALGFGDREHAVFTGFHQFSPVCGVLLKLMLCRRNTTSTGVLLLV